MIQIFTSYHAKAEKLNEMGFAVVSISVGWPKYAKDSWYAGKMPELAPTRAMLKMTTEQYYKEFDKILAKTTPSEMLEKMVKIAAFAKTDKVVLLCYECNRNECHRSYVGKWLENGLGISVEEVDFGQKPKPKEEPRKPIQFSLF